MTDEEKIQEILVRFTGAIALMSKAVRELADGMGCLCQNKDNKGRLLLDPIPFTQEVLQTAQDYVAKAHDIMDPSVFEQKGPKNNC